MKIGAYLLASVMILTATTGCIDRFLPAEEENKTNPVNVFEGTYSLDAVPSVFFTIEASGETSGNMIMYMPYNYLEHIMDPNVAASTTCYDKTLITLAYSGTGTQFTTSWTDANGDVHQGVDTKLTISNDVLTMEREEDGTTLTETYNRFTEEILVYGDNCVKGCTDDAADNYDGTATDDDGTCTYPEPVSGCMDNEADNYNAEADTDDGSCIFSGCMDEDADNYWDKANEDDGGCLYTGCMDEDADNYDAKYNVDDPDSCIFSGCMDPEADNYWDKANEDDGTCEYGSEEPDFDGLDVHYFMEHYFGDWTDDELIQGLHDGEYGYQIHYEYPNFGDLMGGGEGEEDMGICLIEYQVRQDNNRELYDVHFKVCMEDEEEGETVITQKYTRQGPNCPDEGEEEYGCTLYNLYVHYEMEGMNMEMTTWGVDEIPYYGDPVRDLNWLGNDDGDDIANPVTISNMQFSPDELIVTVGDAMITWYNYDSVTHTVTWDEDAPGDCANSGNIPSGESYSCNAGNMTGTYEYHCGYHPSMTGSVVVEDYSPILTWTAPEDHPSGVEADHWLLNVTGENETYYFYLDFRVYPNWGEQMVGYEFGEMGILISKIEMRAKEADSNGNHEVIRMSMFYGDEFTINSPEVTSERQASEMNFECDDDVERCPFESTYDENEEIHRWRTMWVAENDYNFERKFEELEVRIMDCTDDEDDTDEECPEEPEDDQIVFSVNLGDVMDNGGEYTYYDVERNCQWDLKVDDMDDNGLLDGGDEMVLHSYRPDDRESEECAAYTENMDGSRTQQYGITRPYDVEADGYLQEMMFVWVPGFELIVSILAMLGIALRRRLH